MEVSKMEWREGLPREKDTEIILHLSHYGPNEMKSPGLRPSCLLILFVACSGFPMFAVAAEELAWLRLGDTGEVPGWVVNRHQCRLSQSGNLPALEIEADRDPYTSVEWHIRFGDLALPRGEAVTLELQFYDQGAGLMDARLGIGAASKATWLSGSRRHSYTRLNTLTERRAWFEFQVPTSTAQSAPVILRITGLQHLRGVRLLPKQSPEAWDGLRASVPKKVKPMVTLKRPMELVTTSGVDVLGGVDTLEQSLDAITDLAPLARVLGFTSIESYVTWKRLEPRHEGEFDFTFYDAIVKRLAEHDLKWFPLLIVGSGYALPDWFSKSNENIGFACLEHDRTNAIQSIWVPNHRRHVTRVLEAFGRHYEPMDVLEGVRLGPSGNYGESQYPAGGNWGPEGKAMHIHIGWWAGDSYGRADYQRWLREKYGDIATLNATWETTFSAFDDVQPRLPDTMDSKCERLDFTSWYTDSMSDWCAWWAQEARRAMPKTRIYQSAGGWGFRESGTDYSAQAKSMQDIEGGIRLTNETDSYEQNFCATRLAATAARLYGVGLGYEPASSHTARGVVGRIFGTAASNGRHLFTYHSNVFDHQMAIQRWLKYAPLLDTRQEPLVEVAVYYPETENQLSDAAFRHLYALGFNPAAREIRRVVEVDYLDDRLIRAGFLDRYRVLVFAWGNQIPADAQMTIDTWLRQGGTIIYPSYPRGPQVAVFDGASGKDRGPDAASAVFGRWSSGDIGQGSFHRFPSDVEPPELYGEFVATVLHGLPNLHPWTREVLATQHPDRVFFSIQKDGHALVLNYNDAPATVTVAGADVTIEPYGIERVKLGVAGTSH
jgi:hypothetical protein